MRSVTTGSALRTFGATALAFGLLAAAPPPHTGGGGGGGGGGTPHTGGGGGAPPRAAGGGGGAGVPRTVSAPRAPQPVQRQAPVQPGFDLHEDTGNSGRVPFTQPAAPGQRAPQPIARTAPNLHRTIVTNPRHHPNWGWHGGSPWVPVVTFWGGAFWGDYALADIGAQYPLYFVPVAPDSPGAQLLNDYGLTQTSCNADNLVVIDGPDGSVICAFPNNLVGPGTYTVDPTTLTLESV
jgi:hypothetical protein